MPDLIALIPGYQEGPRIGAVVTAALEHLPVIVVDDGSTDETGAEANAAGATVVRQIPNQGKGAALRTGFREALDLGVEAVVTLDGDGQHDPAEIPAFLVAFRATSAELMRTSRQPARCVCRASSRSWPPQPSVPGAWSGK